MKSILFKNLTIFAMFVVVIAPALVLALPANAQIDPWGTDAGVDVKGEIGLGNEDPRTIVAKVVNVIMGFLGIIAVVIILLGGFKWMTAGGNEEKVTEARKLIISGIVGLVIILAAFGIATFVVESLLGATGANV
jgi:hypothetical protein